MKSRTLHYVLRAHTLITGLFGVAFFLFPKESAALWPWALPPLAVRFMGSLFLGGALCSAVCLRIGQNRNVIVLLLMAIGDMLIALVGILGLGEIGLTSTLIMWLILFLGIALALIAAILPAVHQMPELSGGLPQPRSLRIFFSIHLAVVTPVGLAMFLFPVWAQPLWPWMMSPINVRFIGSFFVGAAGISIWCLRQSRWNTLQAALALYTGFTTFATVASVIHFNLFNPARIATWAFFGLYLFVALGSAYFWWRLSRMEKTMSV